MKNITTFLVPFALLTIFTGCTTNMALDAAKDTSSQINNKMAFIEKAAVKKDGHLCVCFVTDLTNTTQKTHFTFVYPLAQIQTNAQSHHVEFVGVGIKQFSLNYGTLQLPGNIIQPSWNLLDDSNSNLTFFPVGKPPTIGLGDDTLHHFRDFKILPDATQTIHLTSTKPIEFVYVDQSMKLAFTIVDVDPTTVYTKHRGYYCLLPLTVPFDIATCPIQAVGWYIGQSMGHLGG